jgi:hypothetical protein
LFAHKFINDHYELADPANRDDEEEKLRLREFMQDVPLSYNMPEKEVAKMLRAMTLHGVSICVELHEKQYWLHGIHKNLKWARVWLNDRGETYTEPSMYPPSQRVVAPALPDASVQASDDDAAPVMKKRTYVPGSSLEEYMNVFYENSAPDYRDDESVDMQVVLHAFYAFRESSFKKPLDETFAARLRSIHLEGVPIRVEKNYYADNCYRDYSRYIIYGIHKKLKWERVWLNERGATYTEPSVQSKRVRATDIK